MPRGFRGRTPRAQQRRQPHTPPVIPNNEEADEMEHDEEVGEEQVTEYLVEDEEIEEAEEEEEEEEEEEDEEEDDDDEEDGDITSTVTGTSTTTAPTHPPNSNHPMNLPLPSTSATTPPSPLPAPSSQSTPRHPTQSTHHHQPPSTSSAGTTTTHLAHLKEIGNLASWTVSTAKPGCGVAELRSPNTNLFWQSDGPQPHHINIHFAKRVSIKMIRIYLDFDSDESYTPTKIAVLSGTGYHDLQEVCTMSLVEPVGWVEVDLGVGVGGDGSVSGGGGCLRTWLIQVVILGNHQNGKDTHVRGLQVFSAASPTVELEEVPYTNSGMLAELEIR